MKMYLKMIAMAFGLYGGVAFTQVGTTTNSPDKSAALDLSGTNKGLLIPQISLTDLTLASPVVNPAKSLMVYNINTSLPGGTGYYYWSGSAWIKMITRVDSDMPVAAWNISGNPSIAGSSFLGTTEPADMIFQTKRNEIMRVSKDGNVGIGIPNPTYGLHVKASEGVRFRNLPQTGDNVVTRYVVIDPATGLLQQTAIENTEGQVLRIGLDANPYNPSTNINSPLESALRFINSGSNSTAMGIAPTGANNFINTIKNCTISTNQTLGAGTNSPARTTDRINLPAGIYKILLRLEGSTPGTDNPSDNVIDIKLIVNNSEYSYQNGVISCTSGTASGTLEAGVFTELLNLSTAQSIDFSVLVYSSGNSKFNVLSRQQVSGSSGYSYRSVLTIERLR